MAAAGHVIRHRCGRKSTAAFCRTLPCVPTLQAVAAALDAMHREDVVGTIAGDDTIFVLLRTEIQAKEFAGSFAKLMETGGF